MTDTHALERTSPKGQKFFGYCTKCGKRDLPGSAALEECPNPSGVTQEEALLRAIDPEVAEDGERSPVASVSALEIGRELAAMAPRMEAAREAEFARRIAAAITAAETAARTNLFADGDFVAHSGETLGFKIECDALTDADLATLARDFAKHNEFGSVLSVPRGGDRFAAALQKYSTSGHPTLIVDDVLTTGASMGHARQLASNLGYAVRGVVIFARGPCPEWITPLFSFGARTPDAAAIRRAGQVEMAQRLRDCGHYDALMEGPRFKNWNLTRLNRFREECEALVAGHPLQSAPEQTP